VTLPPIRSGAGPLRQVSHRVGVAETHLARPHSPRLVCCAKGATPLRAGHVETGGTSVRQEEPVKVVQFKGKAAKTAKGTEKKAKKLAKKGYELRETQPRGILRNKREAVCP